MSLYANSEIPQTVKMNKFLKLLFFISFFLCSATWLHAQNILKDKDLSQVRVDQLSDEDVVKIKVQLAGVGTTIDQAEKIALSKGMSASEFEKLKKRIEAVSNDGRDGYGKLKNSKDNIKNTPENADKDSLGLDKYQDKVPRSLIDPLIFGSELYTSVSPSFEPNLKLATPLNYVLGPDDQLLVSLYGVQQYEGDLLVSPEGSITIPNVGQIKVAGLTIEAATQRIKTTMANSVYPYLKSGASKLSVTLSKIRSIKVLIIGSIRPGTYTLSSLATVFNALYIAGGPSAFGSFREIELVRNNKVERKIDLYRFLLHGDQSDNVALKDNDVIRIPPYKKRIELRGQVKRPGYFEVMPNESLMQLMDYASGFTDTAYRASLKVYQNTDKERKVLDLLSADYASYKPESGDVFVVSKILNRFENRVRISGAVFRPDIYQLTPGLHVADLIAKADGLKEDAFAARGQIIRLQDDLSRSIVSFNVKKAISGNQADNILLQREDEVYISSVLDLRDSFKVTIQGEVRTPGKYEFVEHLSLKDLILQAGGFTDAAYKKIEIARLIRRDSISSTDNRASIIINTEIDGDLSSASANTALQAFDVVTIRRKAGYTIPETVVISGQVQYPGPYAISRRIERVSDILKRAGGYTPDAFIEGAFLKRYKTTDEIKKSEDALKSLEKNVRDTLSIRNIGSELTKEYDKIPIDLSSIMKFPGSIEDLIVRSSDELVIPKFDGQVKISGSVLLTTQVPFQKKGSLKSYIDQAGGFSGDAWRKKTYVVYANGRSAITKNFLFFRFYPKILPGSELIVPKKIEKKGISTTEIVGLSSALASMAGLVIAIIRL